MNLTIPLLSFYAAKICCRRALLATVVATSLVGCAAAPVPQGITDPHEARNRKIHDFNTRVDKAVVRPASGAYGSFIPKPVKRGIGNFTNNLDAPGDVVNNLLQGRIGNAAQNTLRFAVNTIAGIGGIFDTATAIGLPGKPTDFGETLHVWGMGEGNYVEVPFLGPSTQRDFTGMIVDGVLNPVRLALPYPEAGYASAASVVSRLGDRDRFSETVDQILYDSADSYAQERLLYLQNRRFALGQTAKDDSFVDPYEDPYAQ
jgi:phospholipid-binding lipoprotein MlaA